jgi:hypothetical protein
LNHNNRFIKIGSGKEAENMLTKEERLLVADVSRRWTGPNTWGWQDGYRMSLKGAIQNPGFG